MPNKLDATGLTTATQAELYTNLSTAYYAIYGSDSNLASNSPDGQWLNLIIQIVLDLQDLLAQIYNMFDPDNAIGVVLDQRVAINGIQRQPGTFTVTNITLVVSQSINLYGLDQDVQAIYTVSDNAGNKWELQTTQLGVSAGSHVYSFQAAEPGAVLTVPNTITVPVTIVLGVVSINNPTVYTTLGINEESDAALKVRRQLSVSLASQGYLKGLLAALENISGVTSAFVYENNTNATNVDGVPGHSIWVIVAGTAAPVDIATAIYQKRNAGCGMFGTQNYTIIQVDGSSFIVSWDDVIPQTLFIAFTASSINGSAQPNIAAIREGLVASFVPGVNTEVNINQLATAVQAIDSNTLVTASGFSVALTQTVVFSGIAASGTFVLNYNGNASAAINWNDSAAAIQIKLRAVPGLTACTVTGSIASGLLPVTIGTVSALGLLTATSNSLQTVAPAPITIVFSEGYSNTLSPTAKNNQFIVAAADIVILPMILSPSAVTIVHSTTQLFTGLGGYGTYVYSMQSNPSGGTVNSSTGLYTAGATPSTTDVVKVTDAFGNTATATVTVT